MLTLDDEVLIRRLFHSRADHFQEELTSLRNKIPETLKVRGMKFTDVWDALVAYIREREDNLSVTSLNPDR